MFKATGIDHVAVNTNDMEATLQFYCGILGMRLARTSRTGDGRRHYNVEIGGGNAFAFFDGAERPDEATPQYLNHFALPVAAEAVRSGPPARFSGVQVTEIIDREYGKTYYFHDPNGIRLQIEYQSAGWNEDLTGDSDPVPMVQKLAGQG